MHNQNSKEILFMLMIIIIKGLENQAEAKSNQNKCKYNQTRIYWDNWGLNEIRDKGW